MVRAAAIALVSIAIVTIGCTPSGSAPTASAPLVASAVASDPPAPAPSAPDPAASATATTPPTTPPTSTSGPELPRGGRTLFPDYRLVGFCGTPDAPALGPLLNHPAKKSAKLLDLANQYATDRKTMPVFELIAVVVQAGGGNDGKNRMRVLDSVVDEYLQAARDAKGLLLIDVQPGHSDFLTEVQRFEKYLHYPDVGVALDPEWAMLPKQQPGHFFGQSTGEAINQVVAYLSSIVQADNLPEKALVFHQVNDYVVKNESVIAPAPGVAVIKSVDGFGPAGTKINTYNFLLRFSAPGVHPGFKLFFDEDRTNHGVLMTPPEVLRLKPVPEYVMYE